MGFVPEMGEIVARRELALVDRDGGQGRVVVQIGKPAPFPEGSASDGDYYCPVEYVGLGREGVRHAGGVDSVQALVLALERIGIELDASPEAIEGRLRWQEGTDLGFPLPDERKRTSHVPGELHVRSRDGASFLRLLAEQSGSATVVWVQAQAAGYQGTAGHVEIAAADLRAFVQELGRLSAGEAEAARLRGQDGRFELVAKALDAHTVGIGTTLSTRRGWLNSTVTTGFEIDRSTLPAIASGLAALSRG